MTRKHFKDLAERLKREKPEWCDALSSGVNSAKIAQWRNIVSTMVGFCKAYNSNFDEGRFLAACGLTTI